MNRRVLAALAVLVVAAPACSAKTPTAARTTPTRGSPTASFSPSASPTKGPKPPSARLAVYSTGNALWIYDVKTDAVVQVARGEDVRLPRFITRGEVSFVQRDESGRGFLRALVVRTREINDLFSVATGIDVYGWSPDRETVAYVTTDAQSYPHVHYRSTVGEGATRTVTTLARALGREFTPDDQARVEFSPDGERVLIVYTPADGTGDAVSLDQAQLQVRTLDGALAHAPPQSGEPTMGFWSPDGTRVYYRTDGGARFWSTQTGRVRGAPSRPRWRHPWPSRDGRFVAYDTIGAQPGVRVRVLDLRTGGIRTIFKPDRFHPVFASVRTVWAQRIRRCETCLGGAEPAAEVYAFSLRTGKERKLALRSLADVDIWYE